jgi:hypothetical protein
MSAREVARARFESRWLLFSVDCLEHTWPCRAELGALSENKVKQMHMMRASVALLAAGAHARGERLTEKKCWLLDLRRVNQLDRPLNGISSSINYKESG